ncbi:hypothetical protein NG798_27080, partial [Ancylothrix sp. C2]|nr:hypothetical protein [Ancylothrix sp. D3o]
MVHLASSVSPGDAASFQQTYFSIIESFLTAGNYLEDLALKQSQKARDTGITISQGGKVLYGQEDGRKVDYLFGPLSQQLYPDLPQKLNQLRTSEVGSVSTLSDLRVELNNQIVLETDSSGAVKVNELKNLPLDKLPELFQRLARTREKNLSTAIEESIIKALKNDENQSMKSNEPLSDVGLELPPDFDEAILFSDPALSAQATELFGPPPEPSTPATDIETQKIPHQALPATDAGQRTPNRDTPAADLDVEKTPSWDTPAADAGQRTPSLFQRATDVGIERTNSQNTPATDAGERIPNRDTPATDGRSSLARKSFKKARPQLGQNTNGGTPIQQSDIGIPISREETISPQPTPRAPISTEETVKNSTTPPVSIPKEEAVPTPRAPISKEEFELPSPNPPALEDSHPTPPPQSLDDKVVPPPPKEQAAPTLSTPAPNSPINIPISTSERRNNRTSVEAEEPLSATGLGRSYSLSSGLEDTELKALLVEQIKATRELQQQVALSSNQFQELVSVRLNSQDQTNWWEQLKESFKGLGQQVSSKLSGMVKAFHSQQTEHQAATTMHELFQSQVGKDATSYLSEKYSIQRQGNSYTLEDSEGNSLLKWKSTPFGVSCEPGSNKLDSQQLDSIKQLQTHLQSGKISDEWSPVGTTETSQFKRTMSIATNLIGAANKLGSNISLDGQVYKIEATASGCKVSAKDGRG